MPIPETLRYHGISLRELVRHSASSMRILLTMFVLFAGLLILGCERPISMATLDQTAADIFDGTIVVDENGKCKIDAKNNSVENMAYVTTQPGGSKLILFPTWQGKGSNLRGFIYTNGPPLVDGSEIEIVAFQPNGPAGGFPVGLTEVSVESAITKSCYRVSRLID